MNPSRALGFRGSRAHPRRLRGRAGSAAGAGVCGARPAAAEAPTRPPIRNERSRPDCDSLSMPRLSVAVLCTIGDLLLDVVVRTAQPLAPAPTARWETRLAPGGQAANVGVVGGRARLGGPLRRQAGRRCCGRARRSTDRGSRRRARRAACGGQYRRRRRARRRRRRADDGDRPRRLAGVTSPASSIPRGSTAAPGCTSRATACWPSRSPRRRSPLWPGTRAGRGDQRRPLVLELDPRLRAGSLSREPGRARRRHRLRRTSPSGRWSEAPTRWRRPRSSSAARAGWRCRTAGGSEEHPRSGLGGRYDRRGDALAARFMVGGIQLGLEAAARCVGQLGAVP